MLGSGPATPIVGRDDDLRAASGMLAPGRLLTLVGPAGAGKTRLAVELARAEPDAVVVDMVPLNGADQVLPAVALAAGLGDGGARPLLDVVAANLGERAPLLVLDNVEHLLGDGPDADGVAERIAAVVGGSGRTRVLATSRTPVRIPGERLLPVEPLAVPDLREHSGVDVLGGSPAVALFVERVRDGDPSFVLTDGNAPVVAEICVALDGLPLALELAAVHVRALGLDEVLARSRGRFTLPPAHRAVTARHRSLRAALDWSLDRITSDARDVLAALSVFSGGCDGAAATEVSGPGAVDAITELVEHSLLVARPSGTGMRYSMLVTVRDAAAALLDASGRRDATVAAYRGWAAGLAVEVGAAFGTRREAAALDRAEAEHVNLRAALDLAAPGDAVAVRTATDLVWFWDVRGHLTEGWVHLGRLAGVSTGDPSLDASARDGLGRLALARGDLPAAELHLRTSIDASDASGDDRGFAWSSATLALVTALAGGDGPQALRIAESAVERADDAPGVVRGRALCAVAVARAAVGRPDATAAFDEAMSEVAPGAGAWARGRTLHLRGWVAYRDGDPDSADDLQRRALDLLDAIGDRRVVADCLDVLGLVATVREPTAAAARFAAADAVRARAGIRRQPYLDAEVRAAAVVPGPASPLTPREAQVARFIADGLTNAAIGRTLGISERTAERHAENIRGKLGVGSRAQIAAWVAAGRDTRLRPAPVPGSVDDGRPVRRE